MNASFNSFGLTILLTIYISLLTIPSYQGITTTRRPVASNKLLDGVMKEWMNISEYWCFPDNLPEDIIDDVYECFRLSRGNKEFEAQVRCENELFPLNMTKNDVRRKLCKNDKKTVEQFEKCFIKNGLNPKSVATREAKLTAVQKKAKLRLQMTKFKDLVTCMKKATKWEQLVQDSLQTQPVAGEDGAPLEPPSPALPAE